MPKGGYRPTAPQNNPANVNLAGGNGQSGNYSGFAYGQNKALNESRMQGNAAVQSISASNAPAPAPTPPPSPLTPITEASTLPTQDVMNGLSPLGQPNNISGTPNSDDTTMDKARLRTYLPALEHAASLPTSSEAFRNYVRIVRANVVGGPQ
jgi:hypothetical protein